MRKILLNKANSCKEHEVTKKYIQKNISKKKNVQKRRESKNNGMESLDVNPQARDQLNKVPV